MTDIKEKTVLITGAASGIGRLMALKFAHLGARIVAWDIDADGLESLLSSLREEGALEPTGHLCDISSREQIYATAEKVVAEVGPVDVLVNNAGIVSGESFLDLPDEKIEATFAVNTLSLFWTAKAFLPSMIERGAGHVVTVASAAGTIGVAKLADYSASKFAAVGFDEALRAELKQTAPGVKTTVVCPYYIDTGMFDGVQSRFPILLPILKEEEVAERIVQAVLKNRARLVMPAAVHLVPALRALPLRVFDAAASFLGINASMQHFTGRGDAKGRK